MNSLRAPGHPVTNEQLLELRKQWTSERQSYPGWVITPHENRERVWNYTKYWIPAILQISPTLSAPEDLLLLFEFNWRLERCMMPLFLDWVEKIASVVANYEPFPASNETQTSISPKVETYAQLSWAVLAEAWFSLIFAL